MAIKIKGKNIIIPAGTRLPKKALTSEIEYYLSETVSDLKEWDAEHLAINMQNELDIRTKGQWIRPKSELSEWKLKKVL
jgi:hypothetical protein